MNAYSIRVILSDDVGLHTGEEEAEVRRIITAAPGMISIDRIEPHPRGGYLLAFHHDGDLDLFGRHITAAGLMFVL